MKTLIVLVAGLLTISTHAATGKNCQNNSEMACFNPDGLHEGQRLQVQSRMSLDSNLFQATFFVDGKVVTENQLTQMEGVEFCQIRVAKNDDGEWELPSHLEFENHVLVPEKTEMEIDTISWYVNSFFISGQIRGEKLGLMVGCDKIVDGYPTTELNFTNAKNVRKNFKGLIQF